ncbi:anaerobic ribonucleoside triphosphate reductase [Flavonifractor sp. DFI.6.63]|uniref:Anaerobic ribonucleoside triphosphate reductase n=1 Tax=Lawsonibacter hominis TaxID=2763053 RepID=A0A8J6MAA6_9FIRM|nr:MULTISPECIES: anaerobic ribonucleoside triphosphate reductase [Oscillospiraceae]MBC5734210.1 anaerobic ribonucleoside triphosphate reductase [Lawsonibacter hominis]MCQ5030666.1 anaerobic ribonucleoside triphosphate reductase [Flavonifractor sp. DFI.6.63]
MTVTKIRKRDGRLADFNEGKIAQAITKAFNATYKPGQEETAQRLAEEVLSILDVEGCQQPDVEHIQDLVERVLMDNGYVQTAKAYILYRDQRSRAREMNTRLMKTYEDITFSAARESDLKRENANIDGDTAMGSMLKFGSEGAKQFYDMFVLNPDHARAHREGDIHIHDLDFLTLTTTCCQIDIRKLFKGGFSTGHGTLREPNDISSYAALCCIAIQSNQNDQHGGQSVVNFDYGMADGVKKTFVRLYRQNLARALMLLSGLEDPESELKGVIAGIGEKQDLQPTLEGCGDYFAAERLALAPRFGEEAEIQKAQEFAHYRAVKETDRATYQAMEALIHNLNTMHSRAGAQTPFSSINYGMDTSPEGRMVMKNIMLATEAGLGGGETPIFPIQIFRVKEGVNYNPGEPNYDLFQLAIRCSARRLFPNFSFLDAPFNLQYYKPGRPETEIAYMGCRTRVIGNVYDPSREICNGRGNLSFTTINLPRLAIKAKGDLSLFFEGLDRMLDLCVAQLLERFEIQCRKHVRNYPFLMGQGVWLDSDQLDWDDEVRQVLRHGTLSVGFIGLAETLKSLTGEHHGQSEKARVLGLEIISHMRSRMDEESAERGLNFSLLATPAEGLSGRFVKLDKARFGTIPGVTDRDYYTNSFHVPVYFPISAYDKIRIEAPYHALTNAGHISYIEMDGDPTENLEAFEKVIRCMKENGIGYGSVNHPVDRDPVCGFSGIIGDQCPGCGRTEADGVPFERIRRITGYLVGTLDRFNNAKRAEEHDRVKHSV